MCSNTVTMKIRIFWHSLTWMQALSIYSIINRQKLPSFCGCASFLEVQCQCFSSSVSSPYFSNTSLIDLVCLTIIVAHLCSTIGWPSACSTSLHTFQFLRYRFSFGNIRISKCLKIKLIRLRRILKCAYHITWSRVFIGRRWTQHNKCYLQQLLVWFRYTS